ncbi:unnamed protein product [Cylindrotheca closterium]|uniref:Glycolipid transfer protein domain-containing protein n=1 Tax=Cylindrotheca closterium TaxID=2856 RepID=A0AAD2JPX8_9STRA|nr:unnamed protein product [Cylindrotheca closterium]
MISVLKLSMLALSFYSTLAEAKTGTRAFQQSSGGGAVIIPTQSSFNTEQEDGLLVNPQLTESPLSILADDFDHAMVVMNQDDNDIHVGNLLSACEKLQSTIRELGFVSSANDMASNIAKVRNTYSKLPITQRDSMPALLKYEQDVGITEKDRIKDSSATMGILWLGRSINYQRDMFLYILEHPEASPYDAASHAYGATVKPHLSWPLQRLGQAALNGLRSMQKETILAHMGGFDEKEYNSAKDCATRQRMRRVLASWNPIIRRWNQVLEDMGLEKL